MTELLKPQLSNIFCFLVTPQKSQPVFFFYKEHKHESRLYLCKIYLAYCAVHGKQVCTRGAHVILISERTGVFSRFSCCPIWCMKSYVCRTFTGGHTREKWSPCEISHCCTSGIRWLRPWWRGCCLQLGHQSPIVLGAAELLSIF